MTILDYIVMPLLATWGLQVMFSGYIGLKSAIIPESKGSQIIIDGAVDMGNSEGKAKHVYGAIIMATVALNVVWGIGAYLYIDTRLAASAAAVYMYFNVGFIVSVLSPSKLKTKLILNKPVAIATSASALLLGSLFLVAFIQK